MPKLTFVRLALALGVLLWVDQRMVRAQRFATNVLPSVSVSTDKVTYQRFESVIVTVEVTNLSNHSRSWGPPVWGQATVLRFHIKPPNAEFVPRHGILFGDDPVDLGQEHYVWYAPGQTRTASFNILTGSNVWSEIGSYELQVLADTGSSGTVELATTVFSVDSLPDRWTSLSDTLALAAEYALNGLAWTWGAPDVAAMLNLVINEAGLPPHVIEFAKWVRAVYTEADSQVDPLRRKISGLGAPPTATLIDSLYRAFAQEYPSSGFGPAVEQRLDGLRVYLGAEPYRSDAEQ